MRILIGALSIILTAGTAAIELVMRAKYSQYGKSAPPASTEEGQKYTQVIQGYGETPALLNALLYTLPPRIMKMIQVFETTTSYTEWADWFKKGCTATYDQTNALATSVMDNAPDLVPQADYYLLNLVIYCLHEIAAILIWIVGLLVILAWAVLMLATVLLMIGAIVGLALWAQKITSS
jgi:hypothetical protein